MTFYPVRVVNGYHQVFRTSNGIVAEPVGPRWDKPRDAIRYAQTLQAMPVVSPVAATSDEPAPPPGPAHRGSLRRQSAASTVRGG